MRRSGTSAEPSWTVRSGPDRKVAWPTGVSQHRISIPTAWKVTCSVSPEASICGTWQVPSKRTVYWMAVEPDMGGSIVVTTIRSSTPRT